MWLVCAASCLFITLAVLPILYRLDRLGHLVTSMFVLLIWAACTASMHSSDSFYFACGSFSFIVPVLAECLSPVDMDLLQVLTRPRITAFALTLAHSGINSIDRIYSIIICDGDTMDEGQSLALLQMTGTKAAMLFITAVYFRWALARGLEVPFLSANDKLLAKRRGSAQLSFEQSPEYSAELGFVPASR